MPKSITVSEYDEIKDIIPDTKCFYNYRCAKCNNYISVQKSSIYNTRMERIDVKLLIRNVYHTHCIGLDDGEKVVATLVSVSDYPLRNAVDIIVYPEDEDEEDER